MKRTWWVSIRGRKGFFLATPEGADVKAYGVWRLKLPRLSRYAGELFPMKGTDGKRKVVLKASDAWLQEVVDHEV